LLLAAVLDSAAAGVAPTSTPAGTGWVDWSTTTIFSTIHDVTTSYVTVTGPTTTETDFQTTTETSLISVPGPTTTFLSTIQDIITSYVTVAGPTSLSTEINFQTSTETSLISVPGPATTVTKVHVVTQNITTTTTSTTTSISRVTDFVTVSGSCSSASPSGLVLCPTRTINPTYTPPTPLPSNYLWGCRPGTLCQPKREGCNFERDLPADTYVCAPEECLPVAELPSLDDFLAANQYSNDSCAWLTPVDDYFNLNPVDFGLDYDIFDIYGQATCTSTCAAPSTVTVQGTNNWGAWSGPAPTSATGHSSVAPPQVTKRAELVGKKFMKRQAAPLIAYEACYPQCDYAAYVWQSIGKDPSLCDPAGDWIAAYNSATACNNDEQDAGADGAQRVASKLDAARSYCNNL